MPGRVGNSRRHILSCRGSYVCRAYSAISGLLILFINFSVFYGSLNCMKNVYTTNSDWFSCWPGTEDNAVRETLLTFLQIDAYSHYNCSWQSTMSYGDMFNECTGTFNLHRERVVNIFEPQHKRGTLPYCN